jgi:hypothetical protein
MSLKDFIASYRDAFDAEQPSPEVWNRIQQGIARKQNSPRNFQWTLLAAATVVVAVSVAIFQQPTGDDVRTQVVATLPNDDSLYTQEFHVFSQIIDAKYRELSQIKDAQPELYKRFTGDLQKLDSAYAQLKQQLPVQVNQEMVLQAMLQNLTLQVDLINRQLGIIHQINSKSHVTKSI